MQSLLEKGKLPNLRNLIIPDTTNVIIDLDLARADIQVVACEANALRLKALLLEERKDLTKDLHTTNAIELFGPNKRDKKHRDLGKKIAHAANYLVTPRTCAAQTGILVVEAERFIKRWFYLNPEIPEWHKRVRGELYSTRTVKNAFGYRRFFFGRVEELLPEAVAWVPQSTVGLVINYALCNIDEQIPEVQILLQVHDSLTMQCPSLILHETIPRIRKAAEIPIPYPEPWTIPVGFKVSSVAWGECKDYVAPSP